MVAMGSCIQIPEGNSYLMAMCTGFGWLPVGSDCELETSEFQEQKCFLIIKFLILDHNVVYLNNYFPFMEALHTASRLTCPLKCETVVYNDKKICTNLNHSPLKPSVVMQAPDVSTRQTMHA